MAAPLTEASSDPGVTVTDPGAGQTISTTGHGRVNAFRACEKAKYHWSRSAETVSTHQTWTDVRRYTGDITVRDGATLTLKGTVFMPAKGRIRVERGSRLIVDGGKLTCTCPGESWQGIQVHGDANAIQAPGFQGELALRNGAVIENATVGVSTGAQYAEGTAFSA